MFMGGKGWLWSWYVEAYQVYRGWIEDLSRFYLGFFKGFSIVSLNHQGLIKFWPFSSDGWLSQLRQPNSPLLRSQTINGQEFPPNFVNGQMGEVNMFGCRSVFCSWLTLQCITRSFLTLLAGRLFAVGDARANQQPLLVRHMFLLTMQMYILLINANISS